MRDLIFWKTPLLSCLAMLELQLLVSYPVLVPAALVLTPVFFLHRNLFEVPEEDAGPISAQPSVPALLCSLVLGTRPSPLSVEPAPCEASEWMSVSSDLTLTLTPTLTLTLALALTLTVALPNQVRL